MIPILGHKGYCLATVKVTGAEGHSAFPETGASAIFAAGRLLREIERIARDVRDDQDARFSPPFTTLNVGLIQGGKAKNVIPGECTFTVEWRPIPGQDPSRVLKMLQDACALMEADRIRVEVGAPRIDKGIVVPANSTLVEFLGKSPETIPFGTELPYLAALGAEACVFGPGDIRVAHRTGEFVPLAELQKAVDILAAAIDKFAHDQAR
jgi:acetylornithine deacetylase